jgi:lipoprotein-anchoring transpeptidase ErfK/SrfK
MPPIILALVTALLTAGSQQEGAVREGPAKAGRHARVEPRANGRGTACSDPIAIQVLLDRQGFSPGEIDGTLGGNTQRAIAAFQSTHGLPSSGHADCATWQALAGNQAGETLASYTITADDVAGPFAENIPADLVKQADLPALSYRNAAERIAEKFHVSPALVARLNPGVRYEAGASVKVPAVQPFDDRVKPTPEAAAGRGGPDSTLTLEVSREGWLRIVKGSAANGGGDVVFFAPVTSGSVHDPLPPGTWKVTGVSWMPPFHYNPDLFWDANPEHTKATIKPGPNNPVGVVWIGINVEHYGIHGSPEPSRIGHSESHGCVRLTNWDAARVASLVKVGTPVIFK